MKPGNINFEKYYKIQGKEAFDEKLLFGIIFEFIKIEVVIFYAHIFAMPLWLLRLRMLG